MEFFETEIVKDESGRLTFIEIPFNAKEIFSITKGTIYVRGSINDVEYRNRLLSRGKGKYILVLNKALQKQLGFDGSGMTVKVTMSLEENLNDSSMDKIETVTSNMDVVTAIKTRKSIRKFSSKHISDDVLYTIINAGLQAPTAKNKRPYHFIVVKDKKTLEKFSQNNTNAHMLQCADCGVIVCGDSNLEGCKEFLYSDCAAASQNILLCAHGLGIGAVWCGVVRNSEWKKLIIEELSLPLKIEPVSVIALGYPAEQRELCDRWDAGKIHFGKW